MKLLIARIEWMSAYAGPESLENAVGGWAQGGNVPGESYNFLYASDERFYGYWRVGEKATTGQPAEMHFAKWSASGAASVKNVIVAFIAKSPDTATNVLIGFYKDAEVLRTGGDHPDGYGRYRARTAAQNGYLIPVEDRTYHYRYRAKSGWFMYGDPTETDDVALYDYIMGLIAESDPQKEVGVEGYRKRWARRKERFQSPWLRSLVIKSDSDLVCAACGVTYEKRQHPALRRRFEVHHLELFSRLAVGETRMVSHTDLVVLCACCHRTIHAADDGQYVSDIEKFRKMVLGSP